MPPPIRHFTSLNDPFKSLSITLKLINFSRELSDAREHLRVNGAIVFARRRSLSVSVEEWRHVCVVSVCVVERNAVARGPPAKWGATAIERPCWFAFSLVRISLYTLGLNTKRGDATVRGSSRRVARDACLDHRSCFPARSGRRGSDTHRERGRHASTSRWGRP